MLGADAREVHRRLGRVAGAAEVDDHALAERRVLDVVADAQPDGVGVARLRRRPPSGGEGGVDDALAMGVGCAGSRARPCAASPRRRRYGGGRAPVRPRPQALAAVGAAAGDVAPRLDEVGGDLLDEPRRRVVLRRAVQVAAPGVGDEQPLLRPGDADVGEAALLLQLVGLARARGCAGTRPPRRRRGTRRGTPAPSPSAASSARPGRRPGRRAARRCRRRARPARGTRRSWVNSRAEPTSSARFSRRPADSTVSSASSSAR